LPGDLLGAELVIERAVGRGGSSIVYRARRVGTGAPVAVKHLLGGHPDRARMERERGLLDGIDDPRLARVLELGETEDGAAFAVLPWLDGTSLAASLVEPGVTAVEAVGFVGAAADTLDVAHRRGVVHRDLKPAHLWRRPDGTVGLLDFGIARGPGDDRITHTGTTIGTPGYMAPEQIVGGPIGPATDVFALGCVLYEALTGAPAFAGAHPAVLRGKVLWADPALVTARCPEAGDALAALVAAMLAKAPADRPVDARAVATALAAITSPGPGPRRRAGHAETATCPSPIAFLVGVGVPLGTGAADAPAAAITLADRSTVARADASAAGLASLVAALGPGRAIAVARTDDADRGLRWCATAALQAASAASDGAAPAPRLHDLARDLP